MGGLAHAFPEFHEDPKADQINRSSEFKLLSERLCQQERQILPELEAELGRKIQEAEKKGYLRGLTEGELKGMERGRKDVEAVITTLSQAFQELERLKAELYSEAEKVAVRLAIALAEKIIRQEVRTDVSIIIRMAGNVLKELNDAQNITLRLNPHDIKALRDLGYDLQGIFHGSKGLVVREDPSVGEGGFVVDTDSGELDGRIEQQLEAVREILMGEYSSTVQ